MANKLTDNDIKKALECCADGKCLRPKRCPFYKKTDFDMVVCTTNLGKVSLDLINRQKAELAEKDEVIKAQADKIFLYERALKKKTAEIERYKGVIKLLEKDIANAKTEAIKEFAERLKAKGDRYAWMCGIGKDEINHLVKEMTEGD